MSRIPVGLSRCLIAGLLVLVGGCVHGGLPHPQNVSEVKQADLFPQGGDRVVVFVEALEDGRERASVVDARSGQVTHVIEDQPNQVHRLVMPHPSLELTGMGCVVPRAAKEAAAPPAPRLARMVLLYASTEETKLCPLDKTWDPKTEQCKSLSDSDHPESVSVPTPVGSGPTPPGIPQDPARLVKYADVLSDRTLQYGLHGHLVCDAPRLNPSVVLKPF